MRLDIVEMTDKELEDTYNETDVIIKNNLHSYKELMIMDALEQEIDRRGLIWIGLELMEG